ncbi:MAG: hypothetical protein ABSE73_19940 [Planctomycetota bacterium]
MKRLFAFVAFAVWAAGLPGPCAEEQGELVIAPRAAPDNRDLAALRTKLRSPDFAQVQAAARELAGSRNAKAVPLLWALFNDGDAERRMLAVRSVGGLGLAGQEDNLVRVATGERYQAIRLAAAEELARLETPDKAAARLAKVAEEKTLPPLYRWRVLQALAQVKGKVAAECLRFWLNGPQRDMAVAAAEGLARLGDLGQADVLVKNLGANDAELDPAVVEALEKLTGQQYRHDLVKWSEWLKARPALPQAPAAESSANPPEDGYPGPQTGTEGWWDVVLVFDTTGSMTRIWPALDSALNAVLAELAKQVSGLRLGSVRYRAAVPELSLTYMVKPDPLTRDFAHAREVMRDALFGGESGGLHLGLDCALKTMLWRAAAHKMIVLIGDTSPDQAGLKSGLQAVREAWRYDGILVNTVFVRSEHGSEHAATYRNLALAGSGHYFEFDKTEKRLVDKENPGAPQADSPAQLAAKWLTARK